MSWLLAFLLDHVGLTTELVYFKNIFKKCDKFFEKKKKKDQNIIWKDVRITTVEKTNLTSRLTSGSEYPVPNCLEKLIIYLFRLVHDLHSHYIESKDMYFIQYGNLEVLTAGLSHFLLMHNSLPVKMAAIYKTSS